MGLFNTVDFCEECHKKNIQLVEKRMEILDKEMEIRNLKDDVETLLDVILYRRVLTIEEKEYFATKYKEHILENVAKDTFK